MYNKIRSRFNGTTRNINKKLIYIVFIALLLCCFNKTNKYGVVLDSKNREKLPNGSLVEIENTSQNKNTITIKHNETKFIVHKFTIQEFQTREEAEKFRLSINPYVTKYAISKKDTLPLRESPDNYKDNIIYRIPKDSILKIISIGEETKAGSLQGRWIYILTKDGYKGYVFDYALEIFENITGKIITNPLNRSSQDDIISKFKNIKYLRPFYYEKMIANHIYDTDLLKKDYGLFFTLQNEIKINMPELSLTFKFDVVDSVKPNGFLFRSNSSDKDFILLEKEFSNYYNSYIKVKGHDFESKFVLIEQVIEKVIPEMETQNRNLMHRLTSYKTLENETYGSIEFRSDRTFVWKTNSKLNSLPSFGKFKIIGLTPNLQISYKNAIKLIDDDNGEYFCLLDYTKNALQLIFINSENVEDDVIIDDRDKTAIVLFSENRSN
ncbi:SH3 domain-containing protein [Borrelia sp. BU AG58]|uniref:SH3 domain-containing protein n=1 Tax=Borrelia sp. BU AG58 TaxID=2887345 RepID=UPI001E49A77F|nr:SH3 domain-containing protein [Borrelia sp. BU AG58]UER67575.1 SH3 domain-containing protein [Borrelia sp. BU AG58]